MSELEMADNTELEDSGVLADTEEVEDFEAEETEGSGLTETQQFSKRLNEMTAGYKTQLAEVESTLKAEGYEGKDLKELLRSLKAKQQGKTVEELAQDEQALAEQIQNHPDVIAAREMLVKNQFEADLQAIKTAYPEDAKIQKLKDIKELGDDFMALMASGVVGAEEAYAAIKAKEGKGKKPTPQSTGKIGSGGKVEKDYYTSDEVDRLTDEDYKDPSIMEKVRKSMLKW